MCDVAKGDREERQTGVLICVAKWFIEELTMLYAYILINTMLAAALAVSAVLDFIRYEPILVNMTRARVPVSLLTMLGTLKAAGALGLMIGFSVPIIGTAAAVGVILFFVGAILTHLRVRDYSFGLAALFLLVAVTTLGLGLAA